MLLFADGDAFDLEMLLQYVMLGLSKGAVFALIALGYTMVYGIVELINFAHGDLFMLGAFLALTILGWFGFSGQEPTAAHWAYIALALGVCFVATPLFCAGLNRLVDRSVYRSLRTAPKLAPLVSAIGVSFIFMNIGLFWGGPQDVTFPNLVSNDSILPASWNTKVKFTWKDVLVFGVTIPLMVALTAFVRYTKWGKAMRATAQNPTAAQLMGIDTERVIALTFAIGGALAGVAAIMYGLAFNTISYTVGFQNGLYAFTAAVLGGIGNIPGAVLGGLVIGLATSLGAAYVGSEWESALVFVILIVILIFRPTGLLGSRVREKV